MNLLDTSTTWVDIFWMSPNLAEEAFQECIVFLMMEYVSLKMEISLSFVYVVRRRGRLAPRQPLSVCALWPAPREEQAFTASWEPRPPFEAAEMD